MIRITTIAVIAAGVIGGASAAVKMSRAEVRSPPIAAPTGVQEYWVEEVATGLTLPWGMTFLPNGDMLVTERTGQIKILRNGKLMGQLEGVPKVLLDLGWDGLFDIVLDPDFRDNQTLYITYVGGTNDHRLARVMKARLSGNKLVDEKVLYTVDPPLPAGGPAIFHILFLPDKTMLVAIASGDQAKVSMVQRPDNLAGKIIRINRDGTIPRDNPFYGKPGYKPEIYAMGLRNASGAVRTADGHVWVVDIGPKGGDELNELKPGGNYGWPVVTWGFDYTGEAMSNQQSNKDYIDPVLVWVPAQTPSDLMQYVGTKFPGWNGDLFTGGLSSGAVRRIRLRNGEVVLQERMLTELNERLRSIREGPDGLIYILAESRNGRVLRLRPGKPSAADAIHVAKRSGEEGKPSSARLNVFTAAEEQYTKYVYDPAKGRRLFAQNCSMCHSYGEFTSGHVGPDLNGLHGRRSGTLPGYDYSAAFRDPKTQVAWRADTINGFLAAPNIQFPGTKMNIAPMEVPSERRSIADFILGTPAPQAGAK